MTNLTSLIIILLLLFFLTTPFLSLIKINITSKTEFFSILLFIVIFSILPPYQYTPYFLSLSILIFIFYLYISLFTIKKYLFVCLGIIVNLLTLFFLNEFYGVENEITTQQRYIYSAFLYLNFILISISYLKDKKENKAIFLASPLIFTSILGILAFLFNQKNPLETYGWSLFGFIILIFIGFINGKENKKIRENKKDKKHQKIISIIFIGSVFLYGLSHLANDQIVDDIDYQNGQNDLSHEAGNQRF